jgi:SAM-dependent methyltransferase
MEGGPAVLSCPDCGLMYLEDIPPAGEREALYQEEYYRGDTGARFLGVFEKLVAFFRRLRVRAILGHEPGPASLLDVGCGRGMAIEILQKRGWRVMGTQLSRTAAEAARKQRNVEVFVGELTDLALPDGSFRVILISHVLEHVPRPDEYLRKARSLLEENGLLVVEVPNHGGLAFRILRHRHFCFDYPNHLIYFTPSSLTALLQRNGFKIERSSFFSLEYSPFTTLQNMLNFLPGEPNRLYRSFMTTGEGRLLRASPVTWLHAGVACVLAAPALLVSLAALVAPVGNTMRFTCRRARG